ncbi:SRPBCC family protein [Streptomyces silvisoli]|uniref:SRPBCC family protein n=1 Tax=Streptomyces silvisoli TaxID=3034235 RepID=A0ABT5ZXR7_9ACTN|nr:SRPBCC family protein [Streptomyces silvisoli]MDF3294309.1 SRPBCC family protein [Streptomyces silvisoli]
MPSSNDDAGMGALEVRDDGRYVLRFERFLAHSPERVWRALTEADQLRQWFPCDIEGERELGAKIHFAFRGDAPRAEDMPEILTKDPEDLDGTFTAFDPPRLLAYTWGEEDLRWELEPTEGGCRLVFTHGFTEHSGIPHPAGPRKKAARTAAGWDVCLATLEALLNDDDTPPANLWPQLYGHYVTTFDQPQ